MSQQIINVGSAPADGTGDLLRNSQIKANANFTELYTNKAEYSEVLSNNETTYTDATLPLAGTEVALLNDGTNWVKITWNNIKAQLKIYFDTVYQAILVSGTNIKTINGTSILGSGDLTVGGASAETLVTNNTVTGAYIVDWSNNVWSLILTGNTTLTESNLPASGKTKTITLNISGNFTITYPAGWSTFITGAYSGTAALNTITIQYLGVGKYKVLISQPS